MTRRSLMIRRAVIERNTNTAVDAYGQRGIPTWEVQGIVPCYAWSVANRVSVAGVGVQTVEDLRAILPTSVDVHEGDRLAAVTDRRGVIVLGGPLLIETVQRRPDHYEVLLRRGESRGA
jgi:hypothetical protein